ncbi:hypothetical protein A0H81_14189 [Grifola frondosa]|uniref:Uncharacterized protein n=1 Tax=Grifola frondosa TaxID=5627 RepID=A0A1C7LPN4_GRIFR|nr:hypothetical protein A0H81_14189 [Grifola frondosa]
MNSYAHIPRRWRGGGMERMDDELNVDPHLMEDEDYAEWLRAGMWRKKHAAEHAEQARKQAERAARLEREKALKAETARLELAAERERDQRRRERAHMRAVEAREQYDARWKDMLGTSEQQDSLLRFGDIPWPIIGFETKGSRRSAVLIEDFTADAISSFLLPATHVDAGLDEEALKKDRKEKLRETILRFHPDKFEGRIMGRVSGLWARGNEAYSLFRLWS